MIIKNPKDVPAVDVEMEGVKDARVQVLFGPHDNAPTFAMRIFTLGPGGHTPYHDHPFEHEVMILNGQLGVTTPDSVIPVHPGDVLLIHPGETHQFQNLSITDTAEFMCLVPIAHQN